MVSGGAKGGSPEVGGGRRQGGGRPGRVRLGLGLALLCTILGGCATDSRDSGAFRAPTGLSDLYSQANLRLSLAITPAAAECAEACSAHAQFDKRVTDIGARLSAAAYQAYPDLAERIPQFNFSVVDKGEPGTGSTAGGQIVVLRPVDDLAKSDQALSFVLAREVGHVVARHHEENTGTSVMISAITTVIAPALNLAKVLASLASTAVTQAGVSVASFFGSRAVIDTYRPRQQEQADSIALGLLDRMGYGAADVATGFSPEQLQAAHSRWMQDLQASVARLAEKSRAIAVAAAPRLALAP